MITLSNLYSRVIPLREVGDKYIERIIHVQLHRRLDPPCPFPQEDWWNEFN